MTNAISARCWRKSSNVFNGPGAGLYRGADFELIAKNGFHGGADLIVISGRTARSDGNEIPVLQGGFVAAVVIAAGITVGAAAGCHDSASRMIRPC